VATYAQWRTSADRGEVRRVTYVCGDQVPLVEEVVDHVRDTLAVDEFNYVCLSAGESKPAEIWAAAMQYPLTPGAGRLVLVREAERIKTWTPLSKWLDGCRLLPGVHLLFVAAEADVPAPVAALLQSRRNARLVRCAAPNSEDAIAWVRRRTSIDQTMAWHLLERVGGDLATAADVCFKLSLFDGIPSKASIDALCDDCPAESFVDALLAGRKKAALTRLGRLDPDTQPATIDLLISRVALLDDLWRATRTTQPQEVPGWPAFLVRQYISLGKLYDPKRCAYIRRVLAVAEDASRNGARDGVLEALVALW